MELQDLSDKDLRNWRYRELDNDEAKIHAEANILRQRHGQLVDMEPSRMNFIELRKLRQNGGWEYVIHSNAIPDALV